MARPDVRRFDSPDEVRSFRGNGKGEQIEVGGRPIGRGTFQSGWRWSRDVAPIADGETCAVPHLFFVQSGRMRILMDDGPQVEIGPGDVAFVPPGHDAEVVGDEPCVMVDFGGARLSFMEDGASGGNA